MISAVPMVPSGDPKLIQPRFLTGCGLRIFEAYRGAQPAISSMHSRVKPNSSRLARAAATISSIDRIGIIHRALASRIARSNISRSSTSGAVLILVTACGGFLLSRETEARAILGETAAKGKIPRPLVR